ncbi:hypothetical protein Tco_0355403 [Tanacetum coccineum]
MNLIVMRIGSSLAMHQSTLFLLGMDWSCDMKSSQRRIALLVHLESDMLVVRGRSLEFMHVDSRDTCSDQECWIKSRDFQSVDVVPVEREHRPRLVVVHL